jgi:hypothetical protein
MTNEQQGIALVDAASPIAEYCRTAAALADLRSRYAGTRYDVTTTEGMKAATVGRRELRELRVDIEAKRVELKAPIIERGRLLDAEAKRIIGELVALEMPIDAQIKAEEKRKAEEKAAREAAERDRVSRIQQRVQWIRGTLVDAAGRSADAVFAIAETVAALPITAELYGEFVPEAAAAKTETTAALADLFARQRIAEAAAAQVAEDRRKLDEQRAALEREQQAHRDRVAREDAERAARQADEDARKLAAANAEVRREQEARGFVVATPAAVDAAGAQARAVADALFDVASGRTLEQQADPWQAIDIARAALLDDALEPADRIRDALDALDTARAARAALAAA